MRYLSQEFLDEMRAISAGFADRPGASANMQYVVTGGPDGDIHYYWVLVDGKLLALMPLTQSGDFRAMQDRLRAVAEYPAAGQAGGARGAGDWPPGRTGEDHED